MFPLALKTLRRRWGGFVATFIGMFFCGMMLVAAGGIVETGLRTTTPPQRLAAADVVVAGDQSYVLDTNPIGALSERVQVDKALVQRLGELPGVAQAVPDVSFPVTVLRGGQPVDTVTKGRNWDSAVLNPFSLSAGAAPQRSGEVVLDTATAQRVGATVGDRLTIGAHGTTSEFTVSGIAAPTVPTTEQSIFFAAPDVARFVGDPSKVDTVGLVAEPGTGAEALAAQVRQALGGAGGLVVLTGDARGNGEFPSSLEVHDVVLIGGIFVGLSLVAGLLAVASTLSLSLQNRRREIALLRAVGATPRQTRRMILGETLVVSLVATGLAVVPGWFLGQALYDVVVDIGVAPEELAFYQGATPVVVAFVLAVLTSLGAAMIAGRRTLRTRPTAAMAGTDTAVKRTGWVRRVLAALCFAQSGMLVFVALELVTGPLIAGPSNWAAIFFALGVLLIGPDVTRLFVKLLGRLVRPLGGVSGHLAALNAKARVPQMAAVITPIMLMVAIATATTYVTTTEAAAINTYTESLSGNVIIKAGPHGFGPEALERVREVPGVGAASEFTTSAGFVEDPPDPRAGQSLGGWQLKGFTADAAEQVGAAKVTEGSLKDLTGKTVVLNDVYAKELNRGVGDTIRLRLGDNTLVDVKIVALMSEKASFESILLPVDLLAKHTTEGLPTYILAAPAPGMDTARLSAALAAVVSGIPAARIVDRETLRSAFEHHLGAQEVINYLFLALLIGFIAISVANTLFLATGHRRREFGLQRLTGSTRKQVVRMMALEGLLTAVIGIGLGALIAPIAFVTFALARTGQPTPTGPWWIYPLICGVAALLTFGATLAAAARALRSSPLESAQPA